MAYIKSFLLFLKEMLGFRKNSNKVFRYLNDANIKSSIYMSFIVICIEIWMIFRQVHTYIAPAWSAADNKFVLLFNNTSLYMLFIMTSLAIFVFALTYLKCVKLNKPLFIINIVIGAGCILWFGLLFLETMKFTNTIYIYDSICLIGLYATQPILGLLLIIHAFYKKKNQDNSIVIGILVMICFALVCLLFGFKVGYSDFASLDKKLGDNFTPENIYKRFDRIKMITCFLTMVLFVGCLLIWKPYISIIMLTSIFTLFIATLENTGLHREFLEGDKINLITFLISLSIIVVSVYRQRLADAENEEKLEHAAIFDALVDIHNTNYLKSKVKENEELNDAYYEDKIYLFLNIVNFRTINDQKGFEAGNQFLKDLGKSIEEVFAGDIVTRQADDHFIVLTNQNGYMEKIEKVSNILTNLANGLFLKLKVGGYKPEKGEEPIRAVDKARYACGTIKREFDVLFREYDKKMDEGFHKRQYIINHLDEAIKNDWIQAYYQPVVWSKNRELCGAEALARWIDPNYGFLSPGDFIPVLEDTRIIHKLDAHIIDYVCRNMRDAMDRGRKIVPVSINFSRLDFELMDAPKVLDDTLSKYNIDKSYVHVEITESALSSNGLLNDAIDKLENDGYAIWLDDFGSGYSSLNVLKDYEFDVIKIDMKFLSNFEKNEKSKDVIDCVIKLADRLGMRTLTEGVETKEQAEFLEKIGCDRLQGYLFGKPYKLEDFEAKIDSGELTISDMLLSEKI